MLNLVNQHLQPFAMRLLILLIAIHTCKAQVLTAGTNHEQTQQQQQQRDIESRQFGGNGLNANAAFNSNFGSSNFGFNLGGNSFSRPSTTQSSTQPTAAPQQPPAFSNFVQNSNPSNGNSINSLFQGNTIKKESNKNTLNDYNKKQTNVGVIDRFTHHYPDGSYEYRYELTDGTARYERGYFLLYDNKKTLVVVGYYSYRLTDGRYLTVFYNADQNGYRQNQSITPQNIPNLPRSIDVPQYKDSGKDVYSTETSTPSPRQTTTTRRSGKF